MPLVELRPVPLDAAPTLVNLLELYCHDLSPYFALRIGADGRFGYPQPELYWQEPGRRFPFFIMADDALAGFVLAVRGSPATSDTNDLDVAEFFVLRALRTGGIGGQAAFLLWDELPGHWVVRAAEPNAPAVRFWQRTVAAYAGSAHIERTMELKGVVRRVFELDTRR